MELLVVGCQLSVLSWEEEAGAEISSIVDAGISYSRGGGRCGGTYAAAVFGRGVLAGWLEITSGLPVAVRIARPAVLCVPYVIVAISYGQFRWGWFALYLLLPVTVSWLLYRAHAARSGGARGLA